MTPRSELPADFATGWGLGMGWSAVVGVLYELTAVSMTAVGALVGALVLSVSPALRRSPLSLNYRSTTVPANGGSADISTCLILSALAAPLLLGIDRLTSVVATASSVQAAGWGVAAICGSGLLAIAHTIRIGSNPLTPRAALLGALLVPLGVGTLLPALGATATGLLGLIGVALPVLATRLRPPADRGAPPAPSGSRAGPGAAVVAGLAIGSLPLLHMIAVPWISTDPFVLAVLVAGAGAGLAIGSAVGVRGRVVGAGLAAIGVALGVELPARLPSLALELLSSADGEQAQLGYVLPAALMGAVGFVVGAGAGTQLGARRPLAIGLLAAVAWWQLGPGVLGADEAGHAAAIAVALVALPVGLAGQGVGARLLAVVLPVLAAASVFLPAPGPSALPTDEAWRRLGNGRDLIATQRRAERLDLRADADAWGRITLAAREGVPVAWQRGDRRVALDEAGRHADRFLGHLPALLSPAPPRRVLVFGIGRGEVADAARQSSPGRVVVVEPSAAARRIVRSAFPVAAGLLADPAVQLSRVDRLSEGEDWDAVLIDVPRPWAFGAGANLTPRRLRAIRDALAPDGVAILRLPLGALSPSELAAIGGRVGAVFPTVFAWLDPVAAEHLVLTAWRDERPVSVSTLQAAWTRDVLRDDLRSAGLRSPADLLERLVTDRQGLGLLGSGRRDAAGTAVVSAARARRGKATLPLAALASSGRSVLSMVSLDGMAPDERGALEELLRSADASRQSYLSLLGYLAEGRTKEAVALASQLGESSSDPARDLRALIGPWLRRGRGLRLDGQLEKARAELSTAYAFSPRDVDVNLELARTLLAMGQPDDAVAYVQRARDGDPTSVEPVLLLADVRVSQGRLSDAAEGLRDAEPLFPTEVRLLVNLGYILTQLSVGSDETVGSRLARARVLFQRASSLEPRMPQPRAGLAEVYYRQGDAEAALAQIDRALLLQPSCQYRSWRGHILAELSRLPEAEAALQEAVLECPELIDALVMLGAVSADRGKAKEAREMWERVLAIDPQNPAARENLAILEASKLEEFVEQTKP